MLLLQWHACERIPQEHSHVVQYTQSRTLHTKWGSWHLISLHTLIFHSSKGASKFEKKKMSAPYIVFAQSYSALSMSEIFQTMLLYYHITQTSSCLAHCTLFHMLKHYKHDVRGVMGPNLNNTQYMLGNEARADLNTVFKWAAGSVSLKRL